MQLKNYIKYRGEWKESNKGVSGRIRRYNEVQIENSPINQFFIFDISLCISFSVLCTTLPLSLFSRGFSHFVLIPLPSQGIAIYVLKFPLHFAYQFRSLSFFIFSFATGGFLICSDAFNKQTQKQG